MTHHLRLPESAYREYDYYMDTHRLRIAVSNMKNANSRERLDEIRTTVLANLSQLPPAPSAQMQVAPPKTELVRRPGRGGVYYVIFVDVFCEVYGGVSSVGVEGALEGMGEGGEGRGGCLARREEER